jgi:hypothetical protein
MFAITSKVKIAAGIAAGALTLGAAGAYAANAAAQSTVNVTGSSFTIGSGTNTLELVGVNGQTGTLTLPSDLKHPGQCVSFLATHRNYAIAPKAGSTVSKNYHGNLMRQANAFCKAQLPPKTADSAKGDTSDAESAATENESADATDSAEAQRGASHGHGHGHGHGAN